MTPLALDDLPAHSAWARYLLDPTAEPPGDPDAYTSVETYDETYAHLLSAYRQERPDSGEFLRQVYAKGRDDPGPISIRESLYLASPGELLERDRTAVREALDAVECTPETVLDLGCGYGAALGVLADAVPDAAVVGGEYSRNGVDLARALHDDRERVRIETFDFEDEWDLGDAAAGDALVFTRGALTTLSDLETVVDRLGARASDGDLVGGVHLEQVDAHPETTLGLLRRRYGRLRGYSGELLALLERHPAIDVAEVTYDVLGPNPLHPLTAIRWRAA